jgi:hypothetical protein
MLQPETSHVYDKLRSTSYGTVDMHAMKRGKLHGEPIFYAMDSAIRYARAYRLRYDSPLKNDYDLGPHFLRWITGLRGLLNGSGAVAMEHSWSGDSKSNGTIEAMFWAAMELGGFTEADL